MKKDDSSITKLKNRNQTVKRAASLFMESDVVDDSFVQGEEQNEGSDLGNQAPKQRPKLMPLSFISTSKGSEEMPKLELSPSALINLGINIIPDFEAESANDEINKYFLETNFTSSGPRAPIRQASSKSLLRFVDDVAMGGGFMDLESSEKKYFGDTEQVKLSPSASPKASSSRIETAKKNIADKSQ